MASILWAKQLGNVVKKLRPNSDITRFRNDFNEVVSRAVEKNELEAEKVSLLYRWMEIIETWVGSPPPSASQAFEQWTKIYRDGRRWLPVETQAAILSRFPSVPVGSLDWEAFILSCREVELVEVLATRRLIIAEDLNTILLKCPDQFYLSAGLDLAINRSWLISVEPIWKVAECGTVRPAGLLAKEQILVACYETELGIESDRRMANFLVSNTKACRKLLMILLQHSRSAMRLCQFLLSAIYSATAQKNQVIQLLGEWLTVCEAEIERASDTTLTAATYVLSAIRLSALTDDTNSSSQGRRAMADQAKQLMERIAVKALFAAATGSRLGSSTLVLTADELYRAVQDYLRHLAAASSSLNEPVELSLRHERYQGANQVIREIAAAVDKAPDNSSLRDIIESVLFNCGVRDLEKVGETVTFNDSRHECEEPTILSGDAVIVVSSGRRLGEGDEQVVVVKAEVRPLMNSND